MFANNLDKILVGLVPAFVVVKRPPKVQFPHVTAMELKELCVLADDVAPDVTPHHHAAGEGDGGVEQVLILPKRRENMGVDTEIISS